jgi:hypothetical protein
MVSAPVSTRNVLCIGYMAICACGLLLNPIFNIGHDYALWFRNFMVLMKKPENLNLRLGITAHGHNQAKVTKFK